MATRSASTPRKGRGGARSASVDASQMPLFGESAFGDATSMPVTGDAQAVERTHDTARAAAHDTAPDTAPQADSARIEPRPTVTPPPDVVPAPREAEVSSDIAALAAALHARVLHWSQACGGVTTAATAAADAAARLVVAQHEGHVCIRIDYPDERARVVASNIVAVADAAGTFADDCPLVLDATGRLYLQRVFDDERALARRLVQACRIAMPAPTPATQARLHELFAPSTPADVEPDRQAQAAALALTAPVLVVSGGPGTGKTTTLARILDLVRRQWPDARIALAAPTGKAAARVTQALRAARAANPSLALPPLHARTVHAWLRVHPRTGRAAYDTHRPLDIDLLVVDEASMLDLELARMLFDALPAHARVVLLGDRDQLAAVQSGAVFAELAASADESGGESGRGRADIALATAAATPAVVHLRRSYRFGADSGIARLAQALRDGDADAAVALLRDRRHDDEIEWLPLSDTGGPASTQGTGDSAGRSRHLEHRLRPYLDALLALGTAGADHDDDLVRACLQSLDGWRALCAVHDGPSGTRLWNARAAALVRHALTRPGKDGQPAPARHDPGPWFTGRAVMVTRNDSALGLVNGDVGIVLPSVARTPTDDPGLRRAAFLRADGRLIRWPVARLPTVETAFATSVHKAQGSEFDRVTLVLPSPWQRPCTRELVYTAVTRARHHVTLVADEASLRASIATRTQRLGGLQVRLDEARRG